MWNEKEVHQLDTAYTMWLWPLTSLITLTLGFFNVKFWNSCISGTVGLIDVKWKGSELMGYWTDYMTLPFDHTHDLDLEVSRSALEIALSQEWDGRLTWNERDVSRPFMTMIFTLVWPWWVCICTPDSDRVTSDVGVPSTYLVAILDDDLKIDRLLNHWCHKIIDGAMYFQSGSRKLRSTITI